MDLRLPKLTSQETPLTITGAKQVTVIGANGSGKSRFCDEIMKSVGDKAYSISVLRAIFSKTDDKPCLKGSIQDLFASHLDKNQYFYSTAKTEFEQLSFIMLADEFRDLMNYKTHRIIGERMDFPKTRLDATIKVWKEIFPKNKVLLENGKILFGNEANNDLFSPLKLSDGEKAVLYYIGATLYAMPDAVIFVDSPETFIHRSIMHQLWNTIENMRPDCTFVYSTHDLDFASSRIDSQTVWVKSFDPDSMSWDYQVLGKGKELEESLYLDILGTRKPVLFVEGDSVHSIDRHLYQLIFPEYTVKPLGSCNKVIESVRSFNSLEQMHHLDSWGIVDRDRRTPDEVKYLRDKKILVPNVAEVENILMLEGVIRAVARYKHKDENLVFNRVKDAILDKFAREVKEQALQHVRHRVKHYAEVHIDMKFRNINDLEDHLINLVDEINPRTMYEELCREFHIYHKQKNYGKILQVFNQKTIISDSNVAALCGFTKKEDYVKGIISILKSNNKEADAIRRSVKACFGLNPSSPAPETEKDINQQTE